MYQFLGHLEVFKANILVQIKIQPLIWRAILNPFIYSFLGQLLQINHGQNIIGMRNCLVEWIARSLVQLVLAWGDWWTLPQNVLAYLLQFTDHICRLSLVSQVVTKGLLSFDCLGQWFCVDILEVCFDWTIKIELFGIPLGTFILDRW